MTDEPSPRPRVRERLLLGAIVVLASLLRFTGLGHDLQRLGPQYDEEHNFVEPIRRMWNKHTFDPTVYSGYPGLFNDLAFLPVGLGRRLDPESGPYVAARAMVAAFGVLNVVLLWGLCRRHLGPGPALAAAALLAVSRGEVRAAHYVTPDVLTVTGLLAILLLVARGGLRARAVVGAAVAGGLAVAAKYSGLLALPALAAAVLAERRRWRWLALAAAVAVMAFAAGAPYAVFQLGGPGMGAGFVDVVHVYYGSGLKSNVAARGRGLDLAHVATELVYSLGLPAVILAFASPLRPRAWRLTVPLWTTAVVSAGVLSFANLIYSRHVLLLAAAVAALSGAGMAGVLDRMAAGWPRRTVAATLLALVLVPPSLLSVPLAVAFARPGPADLAGEWIERNARERPLVGTAYEQFDLAADGFEVVTFEDWWEVPRSALSQFDLLVVRPRDRAAVPALRVLAEFGASTTGHTIVGSVPRAPLSRLRPDEVRGPEGGSPPAAFDADPSTSWDAPAGPVTISVLWRRPAEVVRVELEVDGRDDSWPQRIAWEGLAEGARAWSPLRVFPLRPHNRARQRADAPHGQVFVLTPPVELRGLRLIRAQGPEWGIAELSVLSGPLS